MQIKRLGAAMKTKAKADLVQKDHDATKKAYSSIDVVSFDPLITDVVLIEQLAFALAPIELPQPFGRIFATSMTGEFAGLDYAGTNSDFHKSLDGLEPARLYKNALKQIFLTTEYREVVAGGKVTKIRYRLLKWAPQKETLEGIVAAIDKELLKLALEDIGSRLRDMTIKVGSGVPLLILDDNEVNVLNDWDQTIERLLENSNSCR
jgi:hypothetical protein